MCFSFPQKPDFLHKIAHQKQVNYPLYRNPHPRPRTNNSSSGPQALTTVSQMSPHRSMIPFQAILNSLPAHTLVQRQPKASGKYLAGL